MFGKFRSIASRTFNPGEHFLVVRQELVYLNPQYTDFAGIQVEMVDGYIPVSHDNSNSFSIMYKNTKKVIAEGFKDSKTNKEFYPNFGTVVSDDEEKRHQL